MVARKTFRLTQFQAPHQICISNLRSMLTPNPIVSSSKRIRCLRRAARQMSPPSRSEEKTGPFPRRCTEPAFAPPKAVAEFARVHITCRTNGTENGEDSARKREREKNVMKRNFAFSPACGNPIESPRVTRALSDICVHISPRKN